MKLTDAHRKSSAITSRYGGVAEDGGVESVLHIEDLGNGKADVVVEHRQNESPLLKINQRIRDEGQKKVWQPGFIHKMIGNIPIWRVIDWKKKYGWDLRKADLNDPGNRKVLDMLLTLHPEYKV